jgi:hypothetical protein
MDKPETVRGPAENVEKMEQIDITKYFALEK